MQEYFDEHVKKKSVTVEEPSRNVRKWLRFYNTLKKRTGYEELTPFTDKEQIAIKDFRYVKYKILSYEVEHKINDLKTFDFFKSKRFVVRSPMTPRAMRTCPNENNATLTPQGKLRDYLPCVRTEYFEQTP